MKRKNICEYNNNDTHLPFDQRLPVIKGQEDDHLPEDQGEGVGLLVQVEAMLAPDVLGQVDAALGAGNASFCFSPIPP